MATRPREFSSVSSDFTDPTLARLIEDAEPALQQLAADRRADFMHFLDGKLREFENGQYDAALREQLDRVQQEAVGAVADMRAAQEELKSKLTVLSDAVAAANQQGTELDQALIAVKAGTSALDTKLNEVNSRIVNYSNMAGNTLAGVLRASIGLP